MSVTDPISHPSDEGDAVSWQRYLDADPPPVHRSIESYFRLAQLVRKRTLMTIAEASAITRRTPETLKDTSVKDLVKAGILEWTDDDHELFRFASGAAWAIGVAFDRDRVLALGFDVASSYTEADAPLIEEVSCYDRPEQAFEAAARLVRALLARRATDAPCLGAGLAVPAPIDYEGICRTQLAGLWWGHSPAAKVAGHLAAGERVPVLADNGASLGALGNYARRFHDVSPARDVPRDLIYVRLSHHIGLGLVLKGKFVRGGHGLAGDLAHRRMASGPRCPRCDRVCLESTTSIDEIERRVRAWLDDDKVSLTDLVERFDEITDTQRAAVQREVSRAGRRLGMALADVCTVIDPSLVVLAGPLTRHRTVALRLKAAVSDGIESNGLPFYPSEAAQRPYVDVVGPTTVPTHELRGAAAMVVQRNADAWLWHAIEAFVDRRAKSSR
jgi:predicted NBD/HSP70 family sugar kinase